MTSNSLRKSVVATLASLGVLGSMIAFASAGCVAGSSDLDESAPVGATDDNLSGATAVSRAMQWVSADLQYCQSAFHQHDSDSACSSTCDREENPAWDAYRSDCSGLVSWAWGLPAPGRVTSQFAPNNTAVSHAINGTELQPGDALNIPGDHIILFKEWVHPNTEAVFIEEPGCSGAITHAHEFTSDVTVSGHSVHVKYEGMTFTAIRFDGVSGGGGSSGCEVGGAYCGGDKVTGDSSTLYQCTGGTHGTVIQHCAHGCSVNPGNDDTCKDAPSGAACSHGGLYCGGDKVSGDHNTLYSCTSGSHGTVVEHCANGCQVNPGANDSCRSGVSHGAGHCVHNALYCGGDKVTGFSSTLYKCTTGDGGTVVQQCAHGCSVNPGANDSCD